MRIHSSATQSSTVTAHARGGTALALAGVAAFSFSLPATAMALTGFGPWTSTGLRGALAGAVAALCLAAARAPLPRRSDWRGLLVVAVGCVVGFPLLTSLALTTSSTAHSVIVIGLLPLATAAFGSWTTGRSQPRAFWLAALAGAAVVVGFALIQNHGLPTTGDLYLLAAVLVCGAGYAEGGRLSAHMPGWQVIAWGLVVGLPSMVAVSALALGAEPARPTAQSVFGLGYVTLVSQFGGFVVWYRGMSLIGVAKASQLQLAQPLMTLVWSATLLGERVPPLAPVAAVLVLVCVVLTQRASAPASAGPIRPAQPNGEGCGELLESMRR